jgi:hypothetical protein
MKASRRGGKNTKRIKRIDFEIRSTKYETNSNDRNPNARNPYSKRDNPNGYLRIMFVERHTSKEPSTLTFFVLVI